MTRQNKIYLASTLTVLAAFATVLCLFAMDGISFTTVVAVSAAAFFAKLTVSFFKVENILRAKAAAARKCAEILSVLSIRRKPAAQLHNAVFYIRQG